MKRTKVSWEVHTLYVLRSQQDKKNFWSATLVLLYQVKLTIAREKAMPNKIYHSAAFFSKKNAQQTIRNYTKKTNLLHPGCYPWECRTETSKTKHSRKSSHSFKVHSLVGKIQTKLLPRATLIQLLNVRLNYFEVYREITLPHFQK